MSRDAAALALEAILDRGEIGSTAWFYIGVLHGFFYGFLYRSLYVFLYGSLYGSLYEFLYGFLYRVFVWVFVLVLYRVFVWVFILVLYGGFYRFCEMKKGRSKHAAYCGYFLCDARMFREVCGIHALRQKFH
ncbi:hypothetical protein METBIDRAFT_103630 [Metschnikowia bicuspidata var. bicuspidata NRRL YB-4993]|uniref:Transmembrane protein n=1 Tax=Metschnikowia bicuspidata var. bicuspidata NRRL YB-4993 TaxID=869754 RepID=A0A1A0HGJ8_9ASCO|nr:hypothetical protein METBIDRAFT_103630 [Metschnikowia bicuspidata var. bicuspidata NRRL YB-4993]OBA23294.1 hypothetical protein METBIDRAFT_103630 [Metschnikowia bicuspidata var. bicuspidata NRRL YB-4993]